MLQGSGRLKAAQTLLRVVDAEAPNRMTAARAAAAVWDGVSEGLDSWPWPLLAEAAAIQFRLVAHGPPEVTVWRLGRADLEALCRDLAAFIERVLAFGPAARAA